MWDNGDIIAQLLYDPMWTFLCVLSRLGPMLTLMPPLQGSSIPTRVKVTVVLMAGAVVTPLLLQYSTPIPTSLVGIVLGLMKEIFLGILLGTSALIIVTALQVGGQIISTLASLDVAQIADPTTEESITVISQMMSWLAMVLFLLLGGHRIMIGACIDSFATYPAGGVLLEEYWLLHLHELFTHSVAIGLRAAAPAAITLLFANLVTALIGRTLPQLNILAIGFNLNVSIMLIVLALSVSSMAWVFQDEFADWIEATTALFPSSGRV